MARGKYMKWLQPDRLAQVENWAAKGCTGAEIAHNMGVADSTFRVWKDKYPALSAAIEKGREESIVAIENAAYKLAVGEAWEETETVETVNGVERRKTVRRKAPPNTAMGIFMLKNRAGYSDNPNATANEAPQWRW